MNDPFESRDGIKHPTVWDAARSDLEVTLQAIFGRQIPRDEVESALELARTGGPVTGLEMHLVLLWNFLRDARDGKFREDELASGGSPEVMS